MSSLNVRINRSFSQKREAHMERNKFEQVYEHLIDLNKQVRLLHDTILMFVDATNIH